VVEMLNVIGLLTDPEAHGGDAPDASNVYGTGDPRPSGLSADGSRAYDQLSFIFTRGIVYALENGFAPADVVRASECLLA
jgi:hypothetical protein